MDTTDTAAARLAIASVVDQVYTATRARIMDGTLARGARIHQEDLADELGVSRTPVREALRRLAAEGLVEMRTNRGARVADVGRDDMNAAYEARLVIEPDRATAICPKNGRIGTVRPDGRIATLRSRSSSRWMRR